MRLRGAFLTFLDLITCGFGGVVALFLLAAASKSPDHPSQSRLLLVRCQSQPPGAELMLVAKPPNQSWLSSAELRKRSWNFSGQANGRAGGEAFLMLPNPKRGKWQFRAILRHPLSGALAEDGVVVRFSYRGTFVGEEVATKPLKRPGDHRETGAEVQ